MGKAIAATARARATVGGTLRTSNLVRSAHAADETRCKLESEYPLTVLATPPLQNDSKPCLHYLATCQLLPQASASAPPSMLLRIRKAFLLKTGRATEKRLCCFAAHPTNNYSPKVQRHLVSRCPGRRRQSPQQTGTLKTMFSRFKHHE